MRNAVFEESLYAALDTTTWHTGLELMRTMRNAWESAAVRTVFGNTPNPPLGRLYVTLVRLEQEGSVEQQIRDEPPENLISRGGRPRIEWRLTERGRRSRAERMQASVQSDDVDGFLPVPV